MMKEPEKTYKFKTQIKNENSQIDIYYKLESSEPITLKKFQEHWYDLMGLKYYSDYELRF